MADQSWRSISPEVARLQDAADAAQARFDDLVVVVDVERTAARTRQHALADAQQTAWQQVSTARDLLTRAQRGSDPETIRAARERLDALYAQAYVINDTGIEEMQRIVRVGLDRAGQVIAAARAACASAAAVTEAVQAHAPGQAP